MLEQHNKEIYLNLEYWKNKKILKDIYKQFYIIEFLQNSSCLKLREVVHM